jgi:hypothetical protein
MAEIILVTRQCYLVAEAINHISLHEMNEDEKDESLFYTPPIKRKRRKKLTAKARLLEQLKKAAQLYQITINFKPVAGSQPNNGKHHSNYDESHVNITVRGYDRAIELYRDMISQIREQMPDRLFLDKMVENFLVSNPIGDDND